MFKICLFVQIQTWVDSYISRTFCLCALVKWKNLLKLPLKFETSSGYSEMSKYLLFAAIALYFTLYKVSATDVGDKIKNAEIVPDVLEEADNIKSVNVTFLDVCGVS